MTQKEAPQTETWEENDSRALEMEIEKEIDALFVPAVLKKDSGSKSPQPSAKPEGVGIAADQEGSEARAEAPRPATLPGDDLNSLEFEIEKEIDALFVPAILKKDSGSKSPQPSAKPEGVGIAADQEGSEARAEALRPATLPGDDLTSLEVEIEKEIDALFVPADRKGDGKTAAAAGPARERPSETAEPVKSRQPDLNLDVIQTEIDKEIDKLFVPSPPPDTFLGASASFEPAERSGGLPGLIEQFNAAYLSLDWDFSGQNLQKFIEALERLEPRASRSADAKSVYRIMEVILKRLLAKPRAVNTKLVQVIRDSQGLLAHLILMKGEPGPHEKQRLKELVEKFQDLRQKAIAAKAGSAPPGSSGVRHEKTLPHSTDISQQLPSGDLSPAASSAAPPSGLQGKEPLTAEMEKAGKAATPLSEPRPQTEAVQGSLRRADAVLLASNGKLLALPESCVVKVARSSCRRCRKILMRGYATLSDYRHSFRSAACGVFEQWAKLGAKELGSYRFEPLGLDFACGALSTGTIAVLASDGKAHRIIFCDTVSYVSDVEFGREAGGEQAWTAKMELRVVVALMEVRGQHNPSTIQ